MTESHGWIVAGPSDADARADQRAAPSQLVCDWDGEIHMTREAAEQSLRECHAAGYVTWALFELRPVSAPSPTGGMKP